MQILAQKNENFYAESRKRGMFYGDKRKKTRAGLRMCKKSSNFAANLTKSSCTYHEKSRKDSIVGRGIVGSDRGSIVLEC